MTIFRSRVHAIILMKDACFAETQVFLHGELVNRVRRSRCSCREGCSIRDARQAAAGRRSGPGVDEAALSFLCKKLNLAMLRGNEPR